MSRIEAIVNQCDEYLELAEGYIHRNETGINDVSEEALLGALCLILAMNETGNASSMTQLHDGDASPDGWVDAQEMLQARLWRLVKCHPRQTEFVLRKISKFVTELQTQKEW